MKRLIRSVAICIPIFLTETGAANDLIVLGVVGLVEDARPYYQAFREKAKSTDQEWVETREFSESFPWKESVFNYDARLPQGHFARIPFSEKSETISRPICLLANDAISKQWIDARRAELQSIKPVCYLVRSTSEQDQQIVQSWFTDIPVVAVNPSFLLTQFAVPAYPALISKRGIEQ